MKVILFDVSNIFYRAFFGNERLSTSDGIPTQGLHGFLRTVHGILKDHNPDYIAFALEGDTKTARHTLEPLYKANRPPPPEDLIIQKNLLPEMLQALNYPTFKCPGLEADDVLATLAKVGQIERFEVLIASADKDFCQLVSNNIKILNLTTNTIMGPEEVYAKYGVKPYQFLDYLSIVGDASDNVKGVDGIGPKGAAKLLAEYDTLENIYMHIRSIKGAMQTKLINSKDQVFKAKQLISFMVAPLGDFTFPTHCVYNKPNETEARALFRKYEFRELENMMLGSGTINLDGLEIGVRK